jgi:hypothetical protein
VIVVVVGMHCSGTANVAALLHRRGVVMGEDELLLPGDAAGTSVGHLENPRFRMLNDRMAERRGYRVLSWSPDIPVCRPGAITRLRMRRLIRSCQDRHPAWGFEDPRSCLTLDAWLREIERSGVLAETRIIHTVREPEAVVRAMTGRAPIDAATALRLWKTYNERAMFAIDAWQVPTHFIGFEDVRDRPERTVRSLLRFIGLPDPEDVRDSDGGTRTGGRDALRDSVSKMRTRMWLRVEESQRSADRKAG